MRDMSLQKNDIMRLFTRAASRSATKEFGLLITNQDEVTRKLATQCYQNKELHPPIIHIIKHLR